MRLGNRVIRATVAGVLSASAALARQPKLAWLCDRAMRSLARVTVRSKGIRPAQDLNDLGRQWQRAFPSAKQVPITAVTDDTVYAQIHTPCPLRGSGDTAACWRMMAYDREVLERAGGQFVVLHSQAEAGRQFCEVAMRPAGASMADLVAAHQRAPGSAIQND